MMKIFAASLTALALIGGPALAADNAASQQREKLEKLWAESKAETKQTDTAQSTRKVFTTTFSSTNDAPKKVNRFQRDQKDRLTYGR